MNSPVSDDRRAGLWPHPATSVLFSAAIFISAFLLFQIQPLISKAILPWFGGTPGVWTTCMLFFQVALCSGYLYSHLMTSRLSLRWQGLLHSALLLSSLAFLSILPTIDWKPTGSESPSLRILLLLLSTAGLPYFVLSTTGPLLLRWFSQAQPSAAPYRLYALSNAGSLLALLSYPVFVEPLLPVSAQARVWSGLYLGFTFLCGLCALRTWQSAFGPAEPSVQQHSGLTATERRIRKPVQDNAARSVSPGIWFLLAMVASTMLLAETNEVCQDVAVIPFLWVVPLSLYLLSFILCFESDRWYGRSQYALGTAVLALAVCWLQCFGSRMFLPLQLLIYFGCLFCVCMLCHGELARLRPPSSSLTAFYLTLSAGGAGGGLFVGLLAPLLFPAFWELYLGLIAACVIAVIVYFDHRGWLQDGHRPPLIWRISAMALFVAVGTVFAAAVGSYANAIAMTRNFYGVLEVQDDRLEDAVVLRHGHIMHGIQLKGIPSLPTMYYGFRTGVGQAIQELRERQPQLRIGLVGLGIGTLAAYGEPGDTFRCYEINEDVTRLAKAHFTFLKNCPSAIDIIHGDARLVLENEPPQDFDLLVLDAFNGDAVPTHLLTAEAAQVYLRHMDADGLIAIHISNLHFDLRRVTDALAASAEMHAITLETAPVIDRMTGDHSLVEPGSRWALMCRTRQRLEDPRFQRILSRSPLPEDRRVLWTDDFSNLFEVLDLEY